MSANNSAQRDANLDLLRAMAILMVVAFHIEELWPGRAEFSHLCHQMANLGRYGVELFFVLSGWLIGGIYWRQQQRQGTVAILPFWKRRWLRTIPPYVVGMGLGWLAVFITRKQSLDPVYLVFLQNYREVMPFYTVSWSLCLEEHFYIGLPLYMWILHRLRISPITGLCAVVAVCPLCRWWQVGDSLNTAFGYSWTATHLRAEGLAMGVILSRLATAHPETWAIITQVCRWLSLPALVMFVTTTFWPSQLFYLVGLTVIPLLWSIVLAAVAGSKPLPGASSRLIYGIAMTSYSVYLTHSLSIHAGAMLGNKIPQLPSSILLGVWLLLIFGIGSGFYIVVEKTSLWLREKISPAGEAGGTRVSEAGRPMVSEPVYGHGTGEFGKERVLTP